MRTIKITKNIELSSLNEEIITLKKVKAPTHDALRALHLIHTHIKGDETKRQPINMYDPKYIYQKEPEYNFEFKIVDCPNSILEVQNPVEGIEYELFYETLADKIKRLKEQEDSHRSNVKSEVEKWQKSVKVLFENISSWVEPYKTLFQPVIDKRTATEELTGAYDVPMLIITQQPNKRITFVPLGTFILGSQGRIDVNIPYYGKSIMLILRREDGNEKWYMIVNRDSANTKEFDKTQFVNLLDELIS